jgi:uncharacterized membrane protein YhaH (DUF805 family)
MNPSSRSAGRAEGNSRITRRIYWWAFLVRVFVGLLAYTLTLYADLPIVEDAQFYEKMGYEVAQGWLSGTEIDFDDLPQGVQTARLLVTAIAAFYYVTGGLRVLPVLLIACGAVTALVPVYVYRFARELQAPEAVARRAGWLVALSPGFVFWSGSLYKEGVTLLLLSVAAYHTLRLQSGWKGQSLTTLVVCVIALWGVRFYLAILLGLAVALSLLWGRMPRAGRFRGVPVFVRQAAITSAFALVIISVGMTVRTEHVLMESDEGVLVNLDVRRAGSAREARSGYLQEASVATPEEALQYFPLGLFYFLTVPFPWQVGALRQNLIIPENAFWLGLYPLMVIGIRRALKSNRPGTVFLLLMTAGMCVVYALLAANVGTSYRMRSQVWLFWAPFAAWGWEVWRERRRPARQGRLARGGPRALGAGSR